MKDHQPMSPNKPFEGKDIANRGGKDVAGNVSVIDAILRDHIPLKKLIPVMKDSSIGRKQKADKYEQFAYAILQHATAEERTLYVHMKEHKELKLESLEGDTEHAIASMLIQEINATSDDNEWLAKVKVLAEMLEHHIEEEEDEDGMLAHVKKMDGDMLTAMGGEYERIMQEFASLNTVAPAKNVAFKH